jgi:glycosyltransferase involved in cell wall biosynthesis
LTKLAFIIPTWNRPAQLEKCVESIASQITSEDVALVIQDDASDKETGELCRNLTAKYPLIRYHQRLTHGDYSDAFRDMFRLGQDYEWVWTFGDDDLLQPGALPFMYDRLLNNSENCDFIHVSERKRSCNGGNVYHAHNLLDLCRSLGWIEMTGFITGNIARGAVFKQAADSPNWQTYAKSAFVQSCALLEVLHDRPCTFYDMPLVDTQSEEMTQDSIARWAEQNISTRYLWIVDAIELMFDKGILKAKLPAKFFRYLNVNMWDRFIFYFVDMYLKHKTLWPDEAWSRIARFAEFLEDEEASKKLLQHVEACRGMATLGLYMQKNVDGLHAELTAIQAEHGASAYPVTFCGEVT